jgi:trimeric autotransporter adhesin
MVSLRPLLQLGISSAFLGLLISCGGSSHSDATLQSIEITPAAGSLAAGTTSQLTATGIYSDGGHRDVTYDASWSSANSAVANVGAGGVATAASQGSTKVSATFQGVTGTGTLTVTAATLVSVEVTPSIPSIANGRTLQFVATGVFSDSSTQNLTGQVIWSSSDATIATVSTTSGSNGLATAVGVGSATISAASGTISGGTKLTVTGAVLTAIAITPGAPSLAKGVSQQFVAMGIFSDNTKQNLTTQVTWSSSSTGVAIVSNSTPTIGIVTAEDVGTTTLTAGSGGVSANVQVTVTPATLVSLQVVPPTASVASGLTQQFTATGIYTDNSTQNLTTTATWATTAAAVASVSNAAGSQGLATSATPGSATISASQGGVSGSSTLTVTPAILVSIAVTPTNPTIAKGLTAQMGATGTYTDHTQQNLTSTVTFASATQGVATVSNDPASKGLAQSVSVGSTIVTATLGGVSGTTTLTVGAAQLVSIQVTASNHTISGKGLTQQFVATGTYTDQTAVDLTTQVTWAPSTSTVATVSNAPGSEGLATSGVGLGTVTITATLGAISGTSTLTVAPAILQTIEITPANLPVFDTSSPVQLTATGHYNDLSTMDLTTSATWTSSIPIVAFVSTTAPTKGLVTVSAQPGTTLITAAFGSVSGNTNFTVIHTTLQSIAITKADPVNSGNAVVQQLTATGTLSDGHTHVDLTTGSVWTTSPTGVVSIDNTTGVATWEAVGSTSITATSNSVASAPFSLTVPSPNTLTVTPAGPTIRGIGATLQFLATGDFSTFGTLNVTSLSSWVSETPATATIVSSGLATSIAYGTSTIQATFGIAGTTGLTVVPSFSTGTDPVYATLSSTCASCHTIPTAPALPSATNWFDPLSAASTYSNIKSLLTTGSITTGSNFYQSACVATSLPSGMPMSFQGDPQCVLILAWINAGGSNP